MGDGAVRTSIVGLQGDLVGMRFAIGGTPVTLGREEDNDVVINDPSVSRWHAELRQEADGYVFTDRHSSNGTRVNGAVITTHHLRSGDEIMIGDQKLRFEVSDPRATIQRTNPGSPAEPFDLASVLRVIVSGGGPVGLTFALLLADLMGPRVAIRVHNGRWKRDGDRVVWKGPEERNVRRQQVVTIQSRQYLKLPQEMQDHLFTPGNFTETWPKGPDSIRDLGPRNIRIAYFEDRLLDLANRKRGQIELVPEPFDADSAHEEIAGAHVLAICEGSRPRTLRAFLRQVRRGRSDLLRARRRAGLRHGAWPEGEVAAARPYGGPADGGAEPIPAELAARRGIPERAAHRPGGEGSRRDRPDQAAVHRLHPDRPLLA